MRPEIFDLDAQATTPLAPEALGAMRPWLERGHWNPHSPHRGGRQAKAAVEAARMQVASLLGTAPEMVHFTSGATESNNLALKGLLAEASGPRRRLVTFSTEHSCLLEATRHLQRLGIPVTILPVRPDGMPDLAAYKDALGPDVALVSAMHVNNEIGSIWPIANMAGEAHRAGALFHCDAAQSAGKIDCRLDSALTGVDLLSVSAHKMHGPKSIGALVVRNGIRLAPLLDGGAQEVVRSGTQSPALAAGFGAAAMVAANAMEQGQAHVQALADLARDKLAAVRHRINGPDGNQRWAGNLSVTFPGVDSGRLTSALPGIALSTGSACSSGSGKPSHVLAAVGLSSAEVRQTLRLGWSRMTDKQRFGVALDEIVTGVKSIAP